MALVFSITVTGILANTLVAPVQPSIVDHFGVSDSLGGLIITAATVPGIVVAPAIGLLADRFGRREVLVPCLVLFGVFGLMAAAAPSYPLLLAARLGQGLGSGGLINLAVVLIADHWEGTERARRIGWNAAVLTTSLAIVPPVGGAVGQLGGWRWTFVPYGLALVTATVVARTIPAWDRHPDGSLADQVREVGPVLRRREVSVVMGVGTAVFVLLFGLVLFALPFHYQREFGLDDAAIGLMLALPAIPSTVAALQLGRLRHRFDSRTLGRIGLVLFALAFLVIGPAPSLPVLALGAVLYGTGEGLLIPSLQDAVAESAPERQRGAVIALWVGFVRLGQSAGPALAGALVQPLGVARLFAAGAAVAIASAAVLGLARSRTGGAPGIDPPGVAGR